MSYNTRRSNQYGGGRGSLNQNFVPGGQFQTTSKPIVQMPRHQQMQKPNYQNNHTPLKSALKNSGQNQQHYGQQQSQRQSLPVVPTPPVKAEPAQQQQVSQPVAQQQLKQQNTQPKQPMQQQQQSVQQPKQPIQQPKQPIQQPKQPAQQPKQPVQQQQQTQQSKPPVQQQMQQPKPVVQQQQQQQIQQPQQQIQQPPQQIQQPSQQIQQPSQQILQQPKKEEMMETDNSVNVLSGEEQADGNEDGVNGTNKKKSFWRHIKAGATSGASKISKKEKRGRRNQRLRKILQPKNALMVLNELVGGQKYTIIESPGFVAGSEAHENFAASVVVEGQEYLGYGKNKNAAKSAAAENALKNILLNKLRPTMKSQNTSQTSIDNDVEMPLAEPEEKTAEEKADDDDVSWLHVASYAIHKLFDSWDADGVLSESALPVSTSPNAEKAVTNMLAEIYNDVHAHQQDLKNPIGPKPVTKKPAKQLPANAELMNPVMLLNQMRPGIIYEDFAKEGSPPAIIFTIKSICDGEEFFGKGNNKKLARKNCAYAACSKIFNITYPSEQVEPISDM